MTQDRQQTFYDAFHGIGGFRYGLEQAGMKCVGGCEIDKYACKAYGVINNEQCEPTDIRTVDPIRLPDFDCLVFGWPCQDNSIAGKRRGQKVGTRSGLLFEAARILRTKKPKYFIAENVEGLFSGNDGLDFYQTIRLFTDLGYDCQWQLLNSRWFLPQNRERIFFVGYSRGKSRPKVFPFEDNFEPAKIGRIVANTLTARYAASTREGVYIESNGNKGEKELRRLTVLECFRLQGYPDKWYYKLKNAGISDSQLYKMAGNGVSSPVVKEIGTRLINSINEVSA